MRLEEAFSYHSNVKRRQMLDDQLEALRYYSLSKHSSPYVFTYYLFTFPAFDAMTLRSCETRVIRGLSASSPRGESSRSRARPMRCSESSG